MYHGFCSVIDGFKLFQSTITVKRSVHTEKVFNYMVIWKAVRSIFKHLQRLPFKLKVKDSPWVENLFAAPTTRTCHISGCMTFWYMLFENRRECFLQQERDYVEQWSLFSLGGDNVSACGVGTEIQQDSGSGSPKWFQSQFLLTEKLEETHGDFPGLMHTPLCTAAIVRYA